MLARIKTVEEAQSINRMNAIKASEERKEMKESAKWNNPDEVGEKSVQENAEEEFESDCRNSDGSEFSFNNLQQAL